MTGKVSRPRCCVYIATSLDGFIARPDGNIDWLNEFNALVPPPEDCGFSDFMGDVDALVMGRNTFNQVMTFGEWFYGETPVIVLSRRSEPLPGDAPQTVARSRESPTELSQRLGAEGKRKLYIDGGLTIQSFLRDGLIDELTITLIPILLGQGKPLFGTLSNEVRLQHTRTRSWEFGFVQNTYRVDYE